MKRLWLTAALLAIGPWNDVVRGAEPVGAGCAACGSSRSGYYGAPACAAPFYSMMPGCCECPPSRCDDAWADYCPRKAQRQIRHELRKPQWYEQLWEDRSDAAGSPPLPAKSAAAPASPASAESQALPMRPPAPSVPAPTDSRPPATPPVPVPATPTRLPPPEAVPSPPSAGPQASARWNWKMPWLR